MRASPTDAWSWRPSTRYILMLSLLACHAVHVTLACTLYAAQSIDSKNFCMPQAAASLQSQDRAAPTSESEQKNARTLLAKCCD